MTERQERAKLLYDALKQRAKAEGKSFNQTDFAELIDKKQSYVSAIITGVTAKGLYPVELKEDSVEILEQKVGLNKRWYFTGEGEMFLDREDVTIHEQAVALLSNYETDKAYVLTQDAFASIITREGETESMRNLPTEELPVDLQGTGTTFIIRVKGESMYPNFLDGEKIYIQPLDYGGDWIEFRHQFSNGKVYVVVTKKNSIHLKRLFLNYREKVLVGYSDNSNQEEFAPMEFGLDDIQAIYYVAGKLSKQFPAPDFLRDPLNTTINKRVENLEADVHHIKLGIEEIRKYVTEK